MTDGTDVAGNAAGDDSAARTSRLDALLATRLAAALPGLAAMQAKYRARCGGGLVAAIVVMVLSLSVEAIGLAAFAFVGILVAGSALVYYAGVYRAAARDAVTPLVCDAIGGMTRTGSAAHEVLGRLRSLPIVAPFAHHTLDDVFSGSHHGTDFVLAEIRLFNMSTRTTGTGQNRTTTTKESTVFKGLLFLIETPAAIPTRIILRGPRIPLVCDWRPAASILERLGFRRIAVPDAGFSRHLTLWAEDGEAALGVIGPGLAGTLARLAATAGWRRLDAGFSGTRFILLLPKGGNSFTVGGLFRPVERLGEEAHALMDEIMVVHRLIDVLEGRAG
ncbi:hypothetical protein [Elioraea sp.]|uniref:hypothetical protein n=1 Tax=Elioraea sp. TaxID=2185103 RepID=UPI0025C510EA|nr:hypothetical protein [Elioraea sp.]